MCSIVQEEREKAVFENGYSKVGSLAFYFFDRGGDVTVDVSDLRWMKDASVSGNTSVVSNNIDLLLGEVLFSITVSQRLGVDYVCRAC
jgi:hypothetical protein